MFCLPSSTFSREFAFWLFTNYAHGQADVCKTWTPGSWTTPMDLQSWPGLLEAWLVLTSVKYHGNVYILIPLYQRLAPTRLQATGRRTKVLGTVLQYSYFSVISRFPLKTAHPFQNLLAVLPLPTLYKVETLKKFWIHESSIVGWGEGLGLCELENAPEMQKCPKTFVHDCSPWIPLWTWAWTTSMDHPYFWRWILLEVFKTNLKNLK